MAWDFDDEFIRFKVTVETRGYIGVGFSPNGGMKGSDIVIGWVDDVTGQGYLSDRHAVGHSEPLVDASQDYTLHYSHQNGTHTVLQISRKLQLCGDEDHFLTVTIPTKRTTYWCQTFPLPRLNKKHHVIKIEPVIQPGLESELHHIVMYNCYHNVSNETVSTGYECFSRNMPSELGECTYIIAAWAVGGGPLIFPAHAGLPFGVEGDATLLMMQTHYDNPQGKQGLVDSSGFRFTLTPDLRKYDAGLLTVGETIGTGQVIPPFADSFKTVGYCHPECLSQGMGDNTQGITVFASMLHSHLLGHAMRVRHFRQGAELPVLSEDNNYDFNYQDTRMMREEVKILPGDHLAMECDYRSTNRTEVTFGGLSTMNEMCLAFLMYYPRIALGRCRTTPSPQYLASFIGAKIG
ncbi:DBH-like monooxygenase protein 1 homolog [Liolophura sinensis]|uniref:DBH-like monooxygenase protein 1 homolog n=1 Tax=Liolophura sinensis TaxID=3198878 RepID=UPI0031581932